MSIEIVSPLGRDYREHVTSLRRNAFSPEGYTQEGDEIVLNPLDGLSHHLLYLDDKGVPCGTISLVNVKGAEDEILSVRGLRKKDLGRVVMASKLAVPKPEDRRKLAGVKLAQQALQMSRDFDYLFVELSPPLSRPQDSEDTSRLARLYEKLFGLEVIGNYDYREILPVLLMGKNLSS